MTPETAKQKIEALLELGTLKGVKVEYENEVTTIIDSLWLVSLLSTLFML